MRSSKWFHLALLLLVAGMLVAPVSAASIGTANSTTLDTTIPKGKPIKLGWAGDETNVLPKPGLGTLYGTTVAVNQRNAAGGIKGFQVELVALDDQCDGAQAPTVAEKFASDPDVLGVVGHLCSGATIPASDVYEKARIVMVSPSSTAVAVTNRGLSVVNRVAFLDSNQALADALYMLNELKVKKLAILDDGAAYGKGLADALGSEFKRMGGEVLLAESISLDTKDYRSVLTKMLANPPDVLFFGGYEAAAALLTQQMKEIGLTNTVFFSDDGAYTTGYLTLAGNDAEGAFASAVSLPLDKERAAAFAAEVEKTFNVKYSDYDPYQAHAYDAANMILDAIDKVAVVEANGDLTVDREALIKAVRETKDFKGLTGTLTCDPKGECGAGEIAVYQVKDSKFELAKSYGAQALAAAMAPAATAEPK